VKFVAEVSIAAPASRVFAFHEEKDVFLKLLPPWQTTEVLQPPTSLDVGTRVVMRMRVGPLWQTMVAEHVAYEPGVMFVDEMRQGPFRHWRHEHRVRPVDDDHCVLIDDIDYELPLGVLGRIGGGWFAKRELQRLFAHRHAVTKAACEAPST